MSGKASRTITSEHVIYHFRPDMEAKWRVKPGEILEIHAPDGLHGIIQTEQDLYEEVDVDHVNDSVGPIFVEGAEPGDSLRFEIQDVHVDSKQGCTLLIPGFGLFKDRITRAKTRISRVEGDHVVFADRVRIPLRPMIGTIGVAPKEGVYNTVTPHDHGGNMDTIDVAAGHAVYFPVNVKGGLLAMGDSKAVMGEGEVCGTGVEVPVVIRAKIDLVKDLDLPRPVIETSDSWMFLASADTLEQACRVATGDVVSQLEKEYRLSWEDAYMLSSLVGDLRISQVVDPLMTVRMVVSKEVLPKLRSL